jgi:hypothetical protein
VLTLDTRRRANGESERYEALFSSNGLSRPNELLLNKNSVRQSGGGDRGSRMSGDTNGASR